jgi:hypothetical protein
LDINVSRQETTIAESRPFHCERNRLSVDILNVREMFPIAVSVVRLTRMRGEAQLSVAFNVMSAPLAA